MCMNVENKQFVEAKLASGEFENVEAVVDEALRRWRTNDAALSSLREAVEIGLRELDRGEGAPLDIEEVIAEGYARHQEGIRTT